MLATEDYSTKFAPWLACGCLSAKRIFNEVRNFENRVIANKSTYWTLFELAWRDFFKFCGVKWGDSMFKIKGPVGEGGTVRHNWVEGEEETKRYTAWRDGKTGVPIVDANMRELKQTG